MVVHIEWFVSMVGLRECCQWHDSAIRPGMEDANLIVRVDIDPKRQRVELGEKVGDLQSNPHIWEDVK